jgi:hypothetical protein
MTFTLPVTQERCSAVKPSLSLVSTWMPDASSVSRRWMSPANAASDSSWPACRSGVGAAGGAVHAQGVNGGGGSTWPWAAARPR